MSTPAEDHARVTRAVLRDIGSGEHRAVVVDSPPGAGKSTFVVDAAELLSREHVVPVVAQTNAQADDLVAKLRRTHPHLVVGRLIGADGNPNVERSESVLIGRKYDDVSDADVVVATAAKWAYVTDVHFPAAIIDEAYQMRSDQLFYVAERFDRALMVGDPGQLDPFTPVDDSRWRGSPDGPVSPAVATVLHHHPHSPVHRLPVSWRLSARCAPLVSEAFYPTMQFRAGTDEGERALDAAAGDGSALDAVIDESMRTGWAFAELPERVCPATDVEAVDQVARIALRVLQRKLVATDSAGDDGPVGADRIAVGVVHRAQRSAVRVRLDELGVEAGVDVSAVTVDTANRLQGREYHVVVVLHPLSGRAAASEFHLETGRLCVLLSRHRHACIVVGRAGIAELLDAHPLSAPIWLGAPIPVPDGWEANQEVLERLAPHTVQVG